MRTFLFSIFMLFAPVSHAEFCNWGFAGPKVHRCNGENYYHGTAACNSGLFRDVFCHERFNQNGQACADDNSAETMACYNRMVAPRRTDPAPGNNEWCNWGFAGPQVITCNGQRFVFGTAACPSGMYSNIFCKEELSESGKACSDDNSDITIRCYNRFMQTRPATRSGNQLQSNPSGAVR